MDYVQYATTDRVGLISIDRPDALNALNRAVLSELDQVLDQVDLEQIRCLVITGAGTKAFIAGADVAEMCCMTVDESRIFSKIGNELFRKIETFPIPIIAAINGYALGGGNELALSCDIRLCSSNAVFGQPEASLGITPGFGGTQRLARVIGSTSKAKELLFTCRNIKADEAKTIGLVSEVFPPESLLSETMALASRVAAHAPIAIRQIKKAVNRGLDMPLDDGIQQEIELFSECFATEDQHEGMQAFIEKRKEKRFNNR